ncbi:polysaccharide biosynthesis C-terminal domain-containing protein, partial [Lachnospiraceae bacterium OttesenSCG-928-D06]|nr:polysaccharide biosynthesis C-terminal domain-containing protein [Lachnospiraceae bacterium OttesenSCG-928-D06]
MTRQEKLFSETSVWKAIASLAVPSMITMIVVMLYNMADMFFVGQAGDTAQVAAVSMAGALYSILMAMGTMLGAGSCIMVARSLGEKKEEKVKIYSSLCFWSGIFLGVIYGVVVLFFMNPILKLLGANRDTWEYARGYISIIAIGAPAMILTSALGNMLRGEGFIREGMLGNLISTAVNLILDPILIIGFHMGVQGAAIATVAANVVGVIYYLLYIRFSKSILSMNPIHGKKEP